jgi:hypothetical protein
MEAFRLITARAAINKAYAGVDVFSDCGFRHFHCVVLWWGEMAPPLKRSPDLGNNFSRTESINV